MVRTRGTTAPAHRALARANGFRIDVYIFQVHIVVNAIDKNDLVIKAEKLL